MASPTHVSPKDDPALADDDTSGDVPAPQSRWECLKACCRAMVHDDHLHHGDADASASIGSGHGDDDSVTGTGAGAAATAGGGDVGGRERDGQPKTWAQRHRKLLATVIPGICFHIAWWTVMSHYDLWYLFDEVVGNVPRWAMSVTMFFGAFVAGATSEGGASIAFPVMTLAFGIKPAVARDFSLMIQSAGMTAAAGTIAFMRVQVEMRALICSSIGGIIGMAIGLEFLAPNLPPAYTKMWFVSTWAAFAFVLFYLNRTRDRPVALQIADFSYTGWRAAVLLVFGVAGGILSSVAGSGIDICTFAALTLLFRVNERVATPTSVVLMAINTVVGFFYRQVVQGGVEDGAWGFLAVCVPVVVFMAPFGSFAGSHFHRLVLAGFVYVTDTVQFVSAFIIVPQTAPLTVSSLGILGCGILFFQWLTRCGTKLLDADLQAKAARAEARGTVQPASAAAVGSGGAEAEMTAVTVGHG